MNKVQKDLICLLKNSIMCKNETVEDIDFDKVEDLAVNHVCLSLAYDGAVKAGLTPPEKWKRHIMFVISNNFKNMNVQAKMTALLDKNNIKYAILKGITVSKNYPEPTYRPLGDVDILVDECNYEKAIECLTEGEKLIEESLRHKFHYHFTHKGVNVEVHKHMTEYTNDEYGDFLNQYLKNALERTVKGEYDIFEFSMLEEKYQMVSLVLHTQRHFAEHKTTLRMLCDFAMYAKTIDEKKWTEEVYPALKMLGLTKFSSALVKMCEKYFGTEFLYKVENVEDSVIEELLEEVLNDGVNEVYISTEKVGVCNKLKGIWNAIGSNAKKQFKVLDKHPYLLPLFYVYLPVRTTARMITGKRNGPKLAEYGASNYRRDRICKDLNIKD